MKKIILCTTFSLLFAVCFSQKEKYGTIERDKQGIITSVTFQGPEKSQAPRSAREFIEQYLGATSDDHFEKVPHKSKRENFVHEHYDQYYRSVKVDGAGYNFHFKDGEMYFANGHYVKINGLNATPSIALEEAINNFLKYKDIDKGSVASTVTELLVKGINNPSDKNMVKSVELVYRIYLQADHANNDEVGFVNAHTGEVVSTEPRLTDLTGTFATRYNGSQQASTDPVTGGHRLFDDTRGADIHTRNMQNNTTVIANAVELVDNDNNWTTAEHAASNNNMGLDVHWALQEIYDYLNNSYGINSFDDAGHAINAYVRFGDDDQERDNAFWDPTPNVLYFGQGVSLFRPLASLDAIAHEFGHGITDFQIGWTTTNDQPAFNEGMSDIWGVILEHRIRYNNPWRIGEQLTLTESFLRNLQNTNDDNALQKMADTFEGSQYNGATGSDWEYVKSGVLSHWFYVLTNGESGINDLSDSYSVTGIGLNKSEELIAEAVFNNYLDGTSTYPAVRTAMINAALAIFCENSPELRAVTDAWYAVGVGAAYSGGVMAITGTSLLCTSNVNFTLSNVPTGASVTWAATNTTPASGTGNIATVAAYSGSTSGNGSLTFTVSQSSCNNAIQKSFWVGHPNKSNLLVRDYSTQQTNPQLCMYEPNYLQVFSNFATAEGIDQYGWQWVSGGSFYNPSHDIGIITPTSSTVYYNLRAHNSCGWSGYLNYSSSCTTCSSLMIFTVHPNPAKTELTISTNEGFTKEGLSELEPIVLEIYDTYGYQVMGLSIDLGDDAARVDVSDLLPGYYIVHLKHNDHLEIRRLLIE